MTTTADTDTDLGPGGPLLAPFGGATDTRRHLAWETALDRLELDVLLYTRLLNTPTDDPEAALPRIHEWDPPGGLGLIPDHLVERAREIAARQTDLRHLMHQAMETARTERETTRRPTTSAFEPLNTPAYLDLRA